MTFGECLRSAREHRKLTYTELSELLRHDKHTKGYAQYLSSIERGLIRPSYTVIEEIADGMQLVFGYRPGMGWTWRGV